MTYIFRASFNGNDPTGGAHAPCIIVEAPKPRTSTTLPVETLCVSWVWIDSVAQQLFTFSALLYLTPDLHQPSSYLLLGIFYFCHFPCRSPSPRPDLRHTAAQPRLGIFTRSGVFGSETLKFEITSPIAIMTSWSVTQLLESFFEGLKALFAEEEEEEDYVYVREEHFMPGTFSDSVGLLRVSSCFTPVLDTDCE